MPGGLPSAAMLLQCVKMMLDLAFVLIESWDLELGFGGSETGLSVGSQ